MKIQQKLICSLAVCLTLSCMLPPSRADDPPAPTQAQTRVENSSPVLTQGDHGERVSTWTYPDGSKARRTIEHPPTQPDPANSTTEGHRVETTDWEPGTRGTTATSSRTVMTEETVRLVQGWQKVPVTRTTTTTEFGHPRHKRSRVMEVKEELVYIADNGVPITRRVTTTTNVAADEATVTTRIVVSEIFDPARRCYVPENSEGQNTPASASDKTKTTLKSASAAGKLQCLLAGDGKATSSCTLILQSKSSEDQCVIVPAFQTFVPDSNKSQIMMSTEAITIELPAGKTEEVEIPTVCASSKLMAPPPNIPTRYEPAEHPVLKQKSLIVKLLLEARELEDKHAFDGVCIAPSRRAATIGQLAIWKESGALTADGRDDVTRDVIMNDLLESVHKSPQSLSKSQRKQLDEGVNSIFTAADLTCKLARQVQ